MLARAQPQSQSQSKLQKPLVCCLCCASQIRANTDACHISSETHLETRHPSDRLLEEIPNLGSDLTSHTAPNQFVHFRCWRSQPQNPSRALVEQASPSSFPASLFGLIFVLRCSPRSVRIRQNLKQCYRKNCTHHQIEHLDRLNSRWRAKDTTTNSHNTRSKRKSQSRAMTSLASTTQFAKSTVTRDGHQHRIVLCFGRLCALSVSHKHSFTYTLDLPLKPKHPFSLAATFTFTPHQSGYSPFCQLY